MFLRFAEIRENKFFIKNNSDINETLDLGNKSEDKGDKILEKVSNPFISDDKLSQIILDSNQCLGKLGLIINHTVSILNDQGHVQKISNLGEILVSSSFPRNQTVSVELKDPDIFEEIIPSSDIVSFIVTTKLTVNIPVDDTKISILKFKLKECVIDPPIRVLHTIWRIEPHSKSLLMLFAFKCDSKPDSISDIRIEANIISEDYSITCQSKPEGIWYPNKRCIVWNLSSVEAMKILAKFDGDGSCDISAGIINVTCTCASMGMNFAVNGENSEINCTTSYRYACM